MLTAGSPPPTPLHHDTSFTSILLSSLPPSFLSFPLLLSLLNFHLLDMIFFFLFLLFFFPLSRLLSHSVFVSLSLFILYFLSSQIQILDVFCSLSLFSFFFIILLFSSFLHSISISPLLSSPMFTTLSAYLFFTSLTLTLIPHHRLPPSFAAAHTRQGSLWWVMT